jgi:hypothetical protein
MEKGVGFKWCLPEVSVGMRQVVSGAHASDLESEVGNV